MMKRQPTFRSPVPQRADKPTLWLLFFLVIAVFMALTFGEAEGTAQIVQKGNMFLISSL